MSLFEDTFGDMFDFDGDGKTSLDEEYLGYMMLHGDARGWESPAISLSDDDDDDFSFDDDDDDDFSFDDDDDDGLSFGRDDDDYSFDRGGYVGDDGAKADGSAPGQTGAVHWNIRDEALSEDCREPAAKLKAALERLVKNRPITISLTLDEGYGDDGQESGYAPGQTGAVHWNLRDEALPEDCRKPMADLKASMEWLVGILPLTISLTMDEDQGHAGAGYEQARKKKIIKARLKK